MLKSTKSTKKSTNFPWKIQVEEGIIQLVSIASKNFNFLWKLTKYGIPWCKFCQKQLMILGPSESTADLAYLALLIISKLSNVIVEQTSYQRLKL